MCKVADVVALTVLLALYIMLVYVSIHQSLQHLRRNANAVVSINAIWHFMHANPPSEKNDSKRLKEFAV